MKKSFLLILIVSLFACRKVSVDINEVIFGLTLSQHTLTADGTSTVNVSVQLPVNADLTKRTVKFKTTSGTWKGGADSMLTVKATFINGQLIANAVYIAGATAKKAYITVQPDQPDASNNNFVLKDSIAVSASQPASIQLTPSGFGINSNYQSEVTFTGLLKNAAGNGVSTGTVVSFTDYLSGGAPANGLYRKSMLTSDATSSVSTIYSVGAYPIGTAIFVKATILDALGQPTPMQDIVKLTINK
jgi:hypothetical protein